jgi:hypothetical protein
MKKEYVLSSKNKYSKARVPDETHEVLLPNAAFKSYKFCCCVVVLQLGNGRLCSGNKIPFSPWAAFLLSCVDGRSIRSKSNSISLLFATENMSQNIKYLYYHHSPFNIHYWLIITFLWEEIFI